MSAVPKLRFPEFDGDWCDEKLGGITAKIGSGVTPKGGQKSYLPNGIPLIRSQNVNGNKLSLSDVAFIDEVQHQKMSGSVVKNGDILLNITGASIGRSCTVEGLESEANVNQHVCIIRLTEFFEAKLLQPILSSDKGKRAIYQAQSGSGREGLNFENIGSFKFSFPSLPEQQKIASFLSSVDKKIDLLRQKKDAIELYKKGLVQKIFSQEIRFKQDDGSDFPDWEEVPFERIAERKSDRHKSGSADVLKIIELENIQSSQGSLTGEIQEKIPSLNNHIFQANDVLFGKLRPYLKKWFFAKFSGACSSEIWVLRARQGVDSEFLYYLVQSELFLTLTQMSSGSKMPRADWKVIADSDFQLPSLAEQVKVSRLLAGIDQKISKLTAFSDQMETFKKGLLQQMFV